MVCGVLVWVFMVPGLVEERSGKRAVWAEPGGEYRWSDARLRPLGSGGLRNRLATLIASNKVRASVAVDNRNNAVGPAASTQVEPRWGLLAEMAERDMEMITGVKLR